MTLRVGLIGCGAIAADHAKGWLAQRGRARVSVVCDLDAQRAEMLANQLDGPEGPPARFRNYDEVLSDGRVDVVDICLPHHLHAEAVVAAAIAGKHILVEKPLCLSLEESERIRAAVEQNGVKLMCAHNMIFSPSLHAAKLLIEDGHLGSLYAVVINECYRFAGSRLPGREPEPVALGWRTQRENMGGGELIDTGYHMTYMLLYLAGSPPLEVSAMLARHRLLMEGEDTAHVLVRFQDGAIGSILTSWAFGRNDDVPLFQVIGEKGQVYGTHAAVYFRPNDMTEYSRREFPSVDTVSLEIAHFVDCLTTGKTPVQTERAGILTLSLILAAYRSEQEGRTVRLGS